MIHFYCFHNDKKIVISDFPVEKIKNKFGHKYEILTSVKDKEAVSIITPRVNKSYPSFIIIEKFVKIKPKLTEETKRKIALTKIGKPRDEATKRKISATKKGKSNFEGKKHTEKTKRIMSLKKRGNQAVKNYYWAHNPNTGKEIRIKSRELLPPGFILGRDYYSYEAGFLHLNNQPLQKQAATNSPKETQSNKDLLFY